MELAFLCQSVRPYGGIMSSFSDASGSFGPGSAYVRGAQSSAAIQLEEPAEEAWSEPSDERPLAPKLRLLVTPHTPPPTWKDLVLTESLVEPTVPLSEVLESVHPDAMVSGRLRAGRSDWPSRPDVVRAELLLPQVSPDHPEYYPHRDGDNLAESTLHADALIDLRVNLRTATAHLPRTYTGLDQLINYNKENRELVLAPDIYVLKETDIKPGDNVKSIRTWEQGVPVFVVELVSDSSLKRDLGHKLRIYARIGVAEYLVWDPLEDHLKPKIQYYRRVGEE